MVPNLIGRACELDDGSHSRKELVLNPQKRREGNRSNRPVYFSKSRDQSICL